MKKRLLVGLMAVAAVAVGVAGMSAFEAHVINVTARIENALNVPIDHIDFGTVFPQEYLEREVTIGFSDSFTKETRVDDVKYVIRQKPKCGWTEEDGEVLLDLPTATGHVIPDGQGGYRVDCGLADEDIQKENPDAVWGQLPLLCPYLSKHEVSDDGTETDNDTSLPAFHQPWTIDGNEIEWLEASGRLSKIAEDVNDTWVIDLAVPCFGDHCAQDWAEFVAEHNEVADPSEFIADKLDEHKVFGCDLWIEVTQVSTSTTPSVQN